MKVRSLNRRAANYLTLLTFRSRYQLFQGRGIVMATLSTGSSATKPVMYIECAMHARGINH